MNDRTPVLRECVFKGTSSDEMLVVDNPDSFRLMGFTDNELCMGQQIFNHAIAYYIHTIHLSTVAIQLPTLLPLLR